MNDRIIALVDVNSMYVSCELLFRPDLRGHPIVAASNNDGCVIARNQEAKALGVKMGEPLFKLRDKIRDGLVVFSSNYTLYGDLSARTMMTLESLAPELEVYSIDEAFLDLTGTGRAEPLEQLCRRIKNQVARDVGLPVCVGASTTKTLAKLANRAAKAYPATGGVVDLTDPERQRRLLAITDISDVWGVGSRIAKRLRALDMHTALDLARFDPKEARRHFSVVLERTIRELNGEACIDLETAPEPQQQIVCSRSFGARVLTKDAMNEALASFAANATARLRGQGRVAKCLSVFIRTSPFAKDPQYSNALTAQLPSPTDDTRVFLERVRFMLDRIWRDGFRYAKGGVMLSDFYDPSQLQTDLFEEKALPGKRSAVMAVLDQVNAEAQGALRFASEGGGTQKTASWKMKQGSLSPRYTTQFSELPVAKIR